MNIEEKNRLQQLEDKVKQLEAQLQDKVSKLDSNREFQSRMSSYQDDIRSEQGKVFLKKNFEIRNRKAITGPGYYEGLDLNVDNVITMSFNKQEKSRLNHIFLGTESRGGNNNCSLISGTAIYKKDIPPIANNGRIEFILLREEDLDNNGVVKDETFPNISVFPMEQFGLTGTSTLTLASGESGYSGLVHQDSGVEKYFLVAKDGFYFSALPTSDPQIEGALWKDGTTLKISNG